MIVPPEQVLTPALKWALIRVLVTRDGYSLALGIWENQKVLAIRKDGTESNPLGFPQVRGLPTWQILPEWVSKSLISTLPEETQDLVRCFIPS